MILAKGSRQKKRGRPGMRFHIVRRVAGVCQRLARIPGTVIHDQAEMPVGRVVQRILFAEDMQFGVFTRF